MFRLFMQRTKFPKFSFKAVTPYKLSFLPLLHPILNDSYAPAKSAPTFNTNVTNDIRNLDVSSRQKMYNELTIGSVTGLFLGIIIGKFSSLIITLSLSVYLLVQFLKSRNLISIPWSYGFKFNNQSFDFNSLVFDNFNFKLSFVSSFLIACYNI